MMLPIPESSLSKPEQLIQAQGRLSAMSPVAVIDIGSNSVRLVVYEGATRSPAPLFNEKVLCGLGRSVAATGRLEGESVDRALEALNRFQAISGQLGAGKPWILATAAIREATNGEKFIREAEKICGAKVLLLSGQREAELAAAGIMSAFEMPDGIAGDLGGGSLELIDLAGAKLKNSTTLQLGGLRLLQRSGGDMAKAQRLIEQDFATVPWTSAGKGRTLFAVGGTWRNIAKLHMAEVDYPLRVTHGYQISSEQAIRFCDFLARGKKLRVTSIDDVPSARREVVPIGALVLKRLLEIINPKTLVFSVCGIREGLLYTLLGRNEQLRDPLLAFCQDYAILRSRSPVHAQELCDWTDRLYQDGGPKESARERRLRHAACLISDISWRTHPDYRGEQGLHLVAHATLNGIDHPGRAFLGMTIYFRHTGDDEHSEFGDRLLQLVDKGDLKHARILGAAIRAVHMLSVGAAGIISRTPVSYEGRRLVLQIPRELAALNGERLRKRFATLAELLGSQPDIRIRK